jgi:ComF family protein
MRFPLTVNGDPLPTLRKIVSGAGDIFFPRNCIVSGRPVDNPPWRYITSEGLAELHRVAAPHCDTCGFPFFGQLAGPQICPHCQDLEPVFRQGRTAVIAKGAARRMVHALKYEQGVHLAGDIARIMLTTGGMAEFLSGAAVVPVPLHPNRLRKRGYNQSSLIAKKLARLHPALRVLTLLDRVKDTQTQTRLDREEREANVKKAFAVKARTVVDPAVRYVVLDDVFTTGATLNACCAALSEAGAVHLDVVTFAHG